MMEKKIVDITVAGHLSIDSIILPDRTPIQSLGGAVTYVSIISRQLGKTVSIISRIGKDFPEAYLQILKKKGINLSWITKTKKEKTTQFKIDYNKKYDRILTLRYKATSLKLNDLPKNYNSKITHLAPIADEISFEVAKKLKKNTDILSLDPQGLLRKFSKNGNVGKVAKSKIEILNLIDIFKSSVVEIKELTKKSNLKTAINIIHDFGVKIVIVTCGSKGAIISICGSSYFIPIFKPRGLIDPTGAGDCFIGGFLAEFLNKKDVLWCASVGAAAASLVIEKMGSDFSGEKEEIYQRAYAIYEKETNSI
jgi:sugar/nucleoside kinase (ribokinase family)